MKAVRTSGAGKDALTSSWSHLISACESALAGCSLLPFSDWVAPEHWAVGSLLSLCAGPPAVHTETDIGTSWEKFLVLNW